MVPEPLSNWALSFGEDMLAVWLTWFATAHPTAAVITVVALMIVSLFLLYHLFRFLRRTFQKLAEI
jgi:membrane protein YdbS with pleckstrin-like domain